MDKKDLPFIGHLEELRIRIIVSLVVLIIGTICFFPFSNYILKILKLPLAGLIEKLAFFSPQEAFMSYLKIAVFSSLMISMPLILYQAWAFISPAIEPSIKKYLVPFILFSLTSFMLGCLFAYFLLLPAALKFLLRFGERELEPIISIGKYVSFVIAIIFCTGLVFEMPLLSFILSKGGIVNYKFLRKRFKYAILVIFIIAAAITPTPDVFNMTLLAIPMLILYEVSIWVSFLTGPRQAKEK
ncbi:MAG: twin-arginine translocase subunit TatC [Candidatus Omnitrophica bacterium]|nr:twin-arginine translocase subunit TatC [Candidatus Omnitrophota bacterium]